MMFRISPGKLKKLVLGRDMFAAVAMLVVESLVDMCGESVRLVSIVIKWYNV